MTNTGIKILVVTIVEVILLVVVEVVVVVVVIVIEIGEIVVVVGVVVAKVALQVAIRIEVVVEMGQSRRHRRGCYQCLTLTWTRQAAPIPSVASDMMWLYSEKRLVHQMRK